MSRVNLVFAIHLKTGNPNVMCKKSVIALSFVIVKNERESL